MKTDIEIARETVLEPISNIAEKLNIDDEALHPYGRYIAKIDPKLINKKKDNSRLILVSAITPTKAGIGKTTVSIGLALGLQRIGKKAIVALREPSLGPCFGMKGGAAGGGYAQVLPMDKINLHFTGDFHAITSANNMLSALVDNYAYQNRNNEQGLSRIIWRRVLDVNDRNLRSIVSGLGGTANGLTTETGFDITAASEIMAILCLSKDINDLRRRLDNILLGYKKDSTPFTVKDLGVGGALTVLLKDAMMPNLVQTTEASPAIIHGGPFANIAHGCNSIIATKTALSLADYTITEAGFAADLGAEKFYDIKCRKADLHPSLTILVATAQALKMHGGIGEKELKTENIDAITKGFANMDKHIKNIKSFGQTVLVCINKFPSDTQAEIEAIRAHCKEIAVPFAVNTSFSEASAGAEDLARLVVDTIDKSPSGPLTFAYDLDEDIKSKIEAVSTKIYGASSVKYSSLALKHIKEIEAMGYADFPICVAKTQYSFSDDPKRYGAVSGFNLTVDDVIVNAGAEMIVVVMGNIMRMPGLPKEPSALKIDIVNGEIEGLS